MGLRAALLLGLLLLPLSTAGFEVKGIEPGVTKGDDMPNLLGARPYCTSGDRPGSRFCSVGDFDRGETPFTVAGVEGAVWYRVDQEGVLESFNFSFRPASFSSVLEAAEGKWGPAKKQSGTVSNAMGAQFDQEIARWTSDKALATLRKRSSNVTEATLTIISKRHLEQFSAEREKKRRSDF